MANRNRPLPGQYRPPDLRGLAHRQLIDPADMDPDDEASQFIEAWPMETAEVELVPTTSGNGIAAPPPPSRALEPSEDFGPLPGRSVVPALGPPPRRMIPVLSAEQHRAERRRSSRIVGNVVLVAVALGLLGGIAFALGAVWYLQPIETERWFTRTSQWIGLSVERDAPPDHELDARLPRADEDETSSIAPSNRPATSAPGDEVPFEDPLDDRIDDAPDDEAAGADPPVDEAPVATEAEGLPVEVDSPEPVVEPVRPRPAPRPRPLPRPRVVVPLPAPTVRPYSERPRPVPAAPAPAPRSDDGLLIER